MTAPIRYVLPLLGALSLPATAADMNLFSQCALVPGASFGGGATTSVGLNLLRTGNVEWGFFDVNGQRLEQSGFAVFANTLEPFVLSQEVSPALAGVVGFLLFCFDDDTDGDIDDDDSQGLAANAFQVNPVSNDVAYLPVVPVSYSDLDEDDINDWDESPVDSLTGGGTGEGEIYLQYFIDGVVDVGTSTTLVIFTTDSPDSFETFTLYGPLAIDSAEVALPNRRLNIIDVERDIPRSRDAEFLDSGLVRWDVDNEISGVFAYSLVDSPLFGAVQTLIGNLEED